MGGPLNIPFVGVAVNYRAQIRCVGASDGESRMIYIRCASSLDISMYRTIRIGGEGWVAVMADRPICSRFTGAALDKLKTKE